MSFINLPVELIRIVIYYTIPESFQALALSCKCIHNICIPFIADYKKLTKTFRNFRYHKYYHGCKELNKHRIRSAFELIVRIAEDPLIARYIETADFSWDSYSVRNSDSHHTHDNSRDELVLKLLAGSQYLKQAGIDYKKYCVTIQKPLIEITNDPFEPATSQGGTLRHHYSQDAAAFLLTLLPNLRELKLPVSWTSTLGSDRLIEAIIARCKTFQSSSIVPSLGQTKEIVSKYHAEYQAYSPHGNWKIISALLALPNLNKFHGHFYCIRGAFPMKSTPYLSLKSINLWSCYFDHKAIMHLLQHIPNITSFQYVHSTDHHTIKEWNVSLFLEAIEHSVGSNLEYLTILDFETLGKSTTKSNVPFTFRTISTKPGIVSMRGFVRLQKLKFPLELLPTNDTSMEIDGSESLSVAILIPPTVLQISLFFDGRPVQQRGLNILFNSLISGKKTDRLALRELDIGGHPETTAEITRQFVTQLEELRNLGIEVNWTDSRSISRQLWLSRQ